MESEFQEWSQQLHRYILARLGDAEVAEDIAQETVLRLLRRLNQGQVVRNPRAWLFQTAKNLAVDVIRQKLPTPMGIEALAVLPDPDSLEPYGDQINTRVGEASVQEVLTWLPCLIQALPENDRQALVARYNRGLSCQELAIEAGISLDNAKVRLHRARKRLMGAVELRLAREYAQYEV
jgi:RNA polymerase sigma-70 factor, ECF subfamily